MYALENWNIQHFFEEVYSQRKVVFDEMGRLMCMSKDGYSRINYKYVEDIWPDTYRFRMFYRYKSFELCRFTFYNSEVFGYFIKDDRTLYIGFMHIHLYVRNMKVNVADDNII